MDGGVKVVVPYGSTTPLFKTEQVVTKAVVLAFFTFFYACSILISIKHFFYSIKIKCFFVLNNVFFVRDSFFFWVGIAYFHIIWLWQLTSKCLSIGIQNDMKTTI